MGYALTESDTGCKAVDPLRRLVTALALGFALSPLWAYETLEEVARLTPAPGNITLTPEGRIILSLHPFYTPHWGVAELNREGELILFPTPSGRRAPRGAEGTPKPGPQGHLR